MKRKRVLKGGNVATSSLKINPIILIVFITGAAVGIFGMWWYMRRQQVQHVATSTPQDPQIIVVNTTTEPRSVTNSQMPVYPEKDPKYQHRSVRQEYQQIGVLTATDGQEPVVLPLFGRRMVNRPDRWEYYTATDKQHMLRIPVVYENRDCQEDLGCSEVYKGDNVEVPVYGKTYQVQLYKNQEAVLHG